jgi:hypothetical protein
MLQELVCGSNQLIQLDNHIGSITDPSFALTSKVLPSLEFSDILTYISYIFLNINYQFLFHKII